MRPERPGPPQVEVVEHGDAGDGLEGAQAHREIRIHDVAGKDPGFRCALQTAPRSGERPLIAVDPDDFPAHPCQARA